MLAEDIAKADADVAAMVKEAYGITDLSLLACDPWSGVPACPPPHSYVHTTCTCMQSDDPEKAGGPLERHFRCEQSEGVCARVCSAHASPWGEGEGPDAAVAVRAAMYTQLHMHVARRS